MPYIQMGGVMGGRTTQILCHCFNLISTAYLAEGVGFEPTIRFPVYTLSKRAPSATRPPLREGVPAISRPGLNLQPSTQELSRPAGVVFAVLARRHRRLSWDAVYCFGSLAFHCRSFF